jgi:glycerol-3-phosphate acyltransferase PlsY
MTSPENQYFALLAIAYLLGGIPFGLLIARAQGIDIRKVGSGNIGATNVVRALGPRFGFIAFGLDMLKGFVPAVIANALFREPMLGLEPQVLSFLAGTAAVIGHAKSPFLKFTGGKGVSTALGTALGSAPLVAAGAFVVFSVVLGTVRYMAVASIVGVSVAVFLPLLLPGTSQQLIPFLGALAIAVILLHHKNIQRLLAGTEPKFKFRKSQSENSTDNRPSSTDEAARGAETAVDSGRK